jgi:hypothetical protein
MKLLSIENEVFKEIEEIREMLSITNINDLLRIWIDEEREFLTILLKEIETEELNKGRYIDRAGIPDSNEEEE